MTSRKRAALRRRDRQAGRKPTAERFAELNANRELPTGMSSKASKLPVWSPEVIEAVRGVVADSGLVGPLELRLRTHPGPKSKLRIETMLMLMLLANWTKCSYVQMDICAVESWLPAEIAFELELCYAGGWSLAGYWALRGQLLRLEEALRDGWEVDGVTYDVDWFSKSLIAATVPPEIAAVIESIAVDLTAFPAWAVCREFISQAGAERAIRQAYINKLPDGAPVPRLDMASPQACEIAAELGITLGPDGLVVRSLDPDAPRRAPNRYQQTDITRVHGFRCGNSVCHQVHLLGRQPPRGIHRTRDTRLHPCCAHRASQYEPRPQKQDGHGLGARDRPEHHRSDRRPRRDPKDRDVRDPRAQGPPRTPHARL